MQEVYYLPIMLRPLSSPLALSLCLTLAAPLSAQPSAPEQTPAVPQLPVPVRQLAQGFGFVEGPVWNPRGFFLFSDIPNSTLWKCTLDGKVAVVRKPTGHSNGNAYDSQGRLLSCEGDRRLSRKTANGTFETLADHFEGKRLNSPNDLALWRDGSIFFSDTTYGLSKGEQELGFQGLYRLHPDGTLQLLDKTWQEPNGLCFSPDFARLYVNDSEAGTLFSFDVNARGDLSNKTLFATIPKPGDPDGMKCDAQGRLFVAAPGGVRVYQPSGKLIGLIPVPKDPANLCFGGIGNTQLFITAREAVYVADVSAMEAK